MIKTDVYFRVEVKVIGYKWEAQGFPHPTIQAAREFRDEIKTKFGDARIVRTTTTVEVIE